MMCWSKEKDSLLSIRDWIFCFTYALVCALFGSRGLETIDELFHEDEGSANNSSTPEISEVEHLQVRWIRVVGRIRDENDVQLEIGATLFDPTSKHLTIPEPPPRTVEARGLRYTLPASHLDWACITPS